MRCAAAAGGGRPFAVVLVDEGMPAMDGLQLKDAVVADPTLTPRVVLLRDLGAPSLDARARLDISAILSKPVERAGLRSALLGALVGPVAAADPAGSKAGTSRNLDRHVGRILLAEDNPINQKVAVAMLSSAGYSVDTVASGPRRRRSRA